MKKSIKCAGLITAALLAVAPVFTTNTNTVTVSAKARTHKKASKKRVKVSKKIAARIARNKKLVKQINQKKIYLFYSNASIVKHKFFDCKAANGEFGFTVGYYSDNGGKYRVNNKTGNIESVNRFSSEVDATLPGYGFTVQKVTAKDRAYNKKLWTKNGETRPLILKRDYAGFKKGEIITDEDNDGELGKVLTYKGHQYFTTWAEGYLGDLQPKDVQILDHLPKNFKSEDDEDDD